MMAPVKQCARLIGIVLRNFLFGGNIASLRFILSPQKLVTYHQACMDLWGVHANSGLPCVTLSEFLNNKAEVSLKLLNLNTLDIMGSSTANMKDRLIFMAIATVTKPKRVFEIGTFRGDSASYFALNAPEYTKIYTLDLPPPAPNTESLTHSVKTANISDRVIISRRSPHNYSYHTVKEGNKVIQLYGNSFDFDFLPYFDKIDLFLIDGAHNYAAVANDTEKALKCVRKNGMIMWHDYGRWGINEVSKFLHRLRRNGYNIQRIIGSHVAVLRVEDMELSKHDKLKKLSSAV